MEKSRKPILKKKPFRFLCLLVLFIIGVYSCTRLDLLPNQNLGAKVLELPVGSDRILYRIANALDKQDKQFKFLDKFAKKEGIPKWSFAEIASQGLIISQANTANSVTTDEAGDTLVLIPLVLSNAEFVNGFISCKVNDTVSFKLFRASDYVGYGFDSTQSNGLSAKKLALKLMNFEKNIFNHSTYRVNDKRIFGKKANGEEVRIVRIKPKNASTTSQLITITECITVEVPNDEGQIVGVAPGEDYEWVIEDEVCTTSYIWYAVEGSGGGTGTAGTGGGDNNNNWYNGGPCGDEPCPGGGSGSGTSGNGAWTTYTIKGSEHLDTWQITTEDNDKKNYWKANNIDKSGLDTCTKKILEKIAENLKFDDVLGRILTKLDRSIGEPNNLEKFNVAIKIEQTGQSSGQAKNFNYNYTTQVFSCDIVLDSLMLVEATDVQIAQTLIHEMIHAYMKSLLKRVRAGVTFDQIKQMGYDSVFNEYIDTLVARDKRTLVTIEQDRQYDHNYMTNKLIEILASAIEKFDNSAQTNKRNYWYLSWGGLQRTRVWQKYWPNIIDPDVTKRWPPLYPAPSEDSTQGLKYAFTLQRLDTMYHVLRNEETGSPSAIGKKRIPGGCY
ncbi:MAG: hypothetical protein WBP45_13485 [Daejeonella sp.]